jgi:hypothetical protein
MRVRSHMPPFFPRTAPRPTRSRKVHRAVLDASGEELKDDATVICLAAE